MPINETWRLGLVLNQLKEKWGRKREKGLISQVLKQTLTANHRIRTTQVLTQCRW